MRLVPVIVLLGTLAAGYVDAFAQSLSGVHVGDDISSALRIGLSPIARNQSGPFTMIKWRLADENELSVTVRTTNRKIVYIESDWGRSVSGAYTDFPGFFFGRTSLAEIRKRFGSNGFTYENRMALKAPNNSIVMFNSYEIANANDLVVTFVTKVSRKDAQAARHELGDYAKLESIVLGEPEYLRNIWGAHLIFDPAYKKIYWP